MEEVHAGNRDREAADHLAADRGCRPETEQRQEKEGRQKEEEVITVLTN